MKRKFHFFRMPKEQVEEFNKAEKEIKAKNVFLDEEEFTIHLVLESELEMYNKFTILSRRRINLEIMEYLEQQAKYIPLHYPIKIEVEFPQENTDCIKRLEDLVEKNITKKVIDCNQELKTNLKRNLLSLLFGLIAMGLSIAFSSLLEIVIIDRLIVIVLWVFIWRAVEGFIFDRRKLKLRKYKLIQLYLAEFIEKTFDKN